MSAIVSRSGSMPSSAQLAAAARPWLIGGIIVMFISGIPLFLAESIKCLYNYAFWVKMTSLGLAMLFTFTVRWRVTRGEAAARVRPIWLKTVALVSLILWFGVGASGRWIGFSG